MSGIKTGDIRMHGECASIDQMDTQLRELMAAVKKAGFHITDMKVSLTFSDQLPELSRDHLVIDREDFDRASGYNFIDDSDIRSLMLYLRMHSYTYMSLSVVGEFIKGFMELYNSCDEIEKFVPAKSHDRDISDQPLDINAYFVYSDIPYTLRWVGAQYQLVQRHLIAY